MVKQTFGERLRALRKARGLGLRELSRLSGVPLSTLQQIESGKRWGGEIPPGGFLRQVAGPLGMTVAQLIGDESAPEVVNHAVSEQVAPYDERTEHLATLGQEVLDLVAKRTQNLIPFVNPLLHEEVLVRVVNAASASQLWRDERQVEDSVMVSPLLLGDAEDPVAYVVVGNCLTDEGIVSGDYLIVDLANTDPHDGDIVVARLNGEDTVKLFYRFPDRVELRPSAAGYETITVTGEDQLKIIGVYVSSFRLGRRRR